MQALSLISALLMGFAGLPELSDLFQARLLYPFATRQVPPAAVGLPDTEERLFETPDGERLVVWAAAPAPGRPVIFYFHGNAGDLAMRAGRFRVLRERGYGLVAPAYRGSSGSTGKPGQRAIERDTLAIGAGMPELSGDAPVILYGESLGAAVAIFVAGRTGPDAVVLEAPFTSIPDVARAHFPGLAERAENSGNTWPSIDRIGKVSAPLLVLHGERDPLIPLSMSRRLLDRAGSADKRLLVVREAGHVDVWRPEARRVLYRFLDRF